MEEHKFIDISSFMLFEYSGDSEADSGINLQADVYDSDGEEDDAQSCSCDALDSFELRELDDDDDVENQGYKGCKFEYDEDDDDDDEVQSVASKKLGEQLVKKSKGCEDMMMSEMEKSRLFWEACLAS